MDDALSEDLRWDLDLAGNFTLMRTDGGGWAGGDRREAKFYRCFARLSHQRSAVRVGLQQLNFGPGRILRALQWFDQLDSRDPTQFTLGVYGALLRQY